jgi:hypothetical protein
MGYKNPVCTSQETHYVSATEPSPLMLYKIWGFHGSDYEECRLLWYKNPDRTSQETHYVSATGPSRLMLCKIWGFHTGGYEKCSPLGHGTVLELAFRSSRILSTLKTDATLFLRNVGSNRIHTAPHPEDGILYNLLLCGWTSGDSISE